MLKKNFVQKYLDGVATEEDIDYHIDSWHKSNSNKKLSHYLGFTEKQYTQWVKNPKSLPQILDLKL